METPARTVGIIGLGFGRAHIPAFQANGCRVVAVCQRNAQQAKAVADAYGVPAVFTEWEAMLDTARPEIVVIATPPHLHRPIALAAFARGAHVLCEKPLALTQAEAREMIAAAAAARRVAMTCFNWRFTAAIQRFHALVAEGALGRVLHAGARWLGARWADERVPATWRMDRAQAGHGAMGDMGVHLIDQIRWNFGEFRRVTAQSGLAYPSRTAPGGSRADAEDFCTVLAEIDSGVQVTLTVSRAAHGTNEHTLEAYGTEGGLAYRLQRMGPNWWEGELRTATPGKLLGAVEVAPIAERTPRGDQIDETGRGTIAPLVARFLRAIATGEPVSPSFEDGRAAQAVLDAVVESTRRSAWVDVPR